MCHLSCAVGDFADAKALGEDEAMEINGGEEQEGTAVVAPVEKSIPGSHENWEKTKKAEESEDKENRPRMTASGGFQFPFSHSASADGEAAQRADLQWPQPHQQVPMEPLTKLLTRLHQ